MTVEHHLQLGGRGACAYMLHGPRSEDVNRRAGHMLLCERCGVILLRTDEANSNRDFVIFCENCGAINTDISQV
jgi:predicted  nucleic acid-binding Zn-ribbon protein